MGRIPTLYFCAHEGCSAKFNRLGKLECHERTHTGERPFVCDIEGCDKSYMRLSHLKRHQESHEGNFSCTVEGCCEIFKTKASLQKHIDFFHHKKKHKTYKCSLCDKEFNKHNWLQRHLFRHTGQLPHVCQEEGCDRAFLLPSRLKRHMQYHKGYPCTKPNCDRVFPNWSFLVKHIKECHPVVHTCESCGKHFSCASNLKRHRVVHRGEEDDQQKREVFPCEFPNCVRFYTQKKNLVHHRKYFHDRRPFTCSRELCQRAFKTQDSLDKHILYHDSKKPRKKKKPKPTLAAKLAGCVPPQTPDHEKRRTEVHPKEKNLPDYVTVTVTFEGDVPQPEDGDEVKPKSCLALLEDIIQCTSLFRENS